MEAVNEEKAQCIIGSISMQARAEYISPTADIVQYPHFEAGVVKIKKVLKIR